MAEVSTALSHVNINDVKEQIADQLRAFMTSLIPKEAFDKVIQDSWDRLTKSRKVNKGSSYSPDWVESPSELDEMVTAEMRQQLKLKVDAWGKEWSKTYDADDSAKQVLFELVNHAAGAFIRNAARGVVDEAVLAIKANCAIKCGGCSKPAIRSTNCPCGWYNSA